jgi:hypothetical protein
MKKATPRVRPTTVLFEPSTRAGPWELMFRMSQLLQMNCAFNMPPRPIDCTSDITRTNILTKQQKHYYSFDIYVFF